MERIDQIFKHPAYREALAKIEDLEKTRIFCGHDFTHFLDVARIAYIMNLEEGRKLPKAQIYAAALLHDIGRHEQYLYGTPHHEASAKIAGKILSECGFLEEEKVNILEAILEHRQSPEIKAIFRQCYIGQIKCPDRVIGVKQSRNVIGAIQRKIIRYSTRRKEFS